MLKLTNIVKDYVISDMKVNALRGVDITFRRNEFVAVLGPSGCGKTTLLNIIGGLDRYTSGDLSVNGISTKLYTDRDWDSYRNHKIGFVFQTYNLIPHQNVLANVELALTLSGVSKEERRKRALDALEKVGLSDQINKKPSQMSGGQQQRVAIARALVNDPDIILADEPTGALDTETSVQIMEILKNISGDKLIIMVTHNPDLADTYATRIVKLVDGKIISDSSPVTEEELKLQSNGSEKNAAQAEGEKSVKKSVKKTDKKDKKKLSYGKVSMSFFTALSLSLNNLLTKKGRTFLTSLAGSIGIIGIALILSLSNGIQSYIDTVQRDTLASYPLQINSETVDYSALLSSMMGEESNEEFDEDKIYSNTAMLKLLSALSAEIKKNNLQKFKEYIESGDFDEYISAIKYGYTSKMFIYSYNASSIVATAPKNSLVYPSSVVEEVMGAMGGSMGGDMSSVATSMYNMEPWCEIIEGKNGEIINPIIKEQYDLIGEGSRFPENYNEVVIVVTKDNQISDLSLYSMGIKDNAAIKDLIKDMLMNPDKTGESSIDSKPMEFELEQLLGLQFKLVLPHEMYKEQANGTWTERNDIGNIIENGTTLKVVGIIRPNENAVSTSIEGTIAYTSALTKYVIEECAKSDLLKQQIANPDTDVFTGQKFDTVEYGKDNVDELLERATPDAIAIMMGMLNEKLQQYNMPPITTVEELSKMMSELMSNDEIASLAQTMLGISGSTYKSNTEKLGYCDLKAPTSISIYSTTFEGKEELTDAIRLYNNSEIDAGRDDNVIRYTDYVAIVMSSFSDIVQFISYGLIAFVSVSLVVSSIMIGIITYISVLERTKEIGILRAIGASKKDVKRVFNAESVIMGFTSGVMGILATLLLILPVNLVLAYLTGINNIAALPFVGAFILIAISTVLTLIAGLIPASVAAKRDPVTSLRSE